MKAILFGQRRPRFVLEAVGGNHNNVPIERADHFHIVADVVRLKDIYLLDDVFVVIPTERKWSLAALRGAAGVRVFGSANRTGTPNRVGKGLIHKIAEVTPRRNVPPFG